MSHVSPENGTGKTIAASIYEDLKDTELEENLVMAGSDSTGSMTGKHQGAIRHMEILIGRALQWIICLLHLNELPLRHVFTTLDGTTNSPDSFKGDIGKELGGDVCDWPVVRFKSIPNKEFPTLPEEVVADLSTDQYICYRLCHAVISGICANDLKFRNIGPLCHSRWLTLGGRILRNYMSVRKPSENLITMAKFCVKVYFPSWFHIKLHNKCTEGPKNYFYMLKLAREFPEKQVCNISLKNLESNRYWAHPENMLMGMLADEDVKLREKAVSIILNLRQASQDSNSDSILEDEDVPDTADEGSL